MIFHHKKLNILDKMILDYLYQYLSLKICEEIIRSIESFTHFKPNFHEMYSDNVGKILTLSSPRN
jgi:hypothetical protein